MSVNFDIKRKITVDGKEYESLDQVPEEVRAAVQKSLASGPAAKATIYINGKTYGSVEELPAPLRAVVSCLTSLAMKSDAQLPSASEAGAVRPEPVLSLKMIVVGIALAAMLFWLVRLVS